MESAALQPSGPSGSGTMSKVVLERWRSEVEDMLEDAIAAHRFKYAETAENMAFYRGLQFGQATRLGFFAEDRAEGEEREVRNYIAPTVASLVAERLRAWPNFKVTASATDIGSITTARFQERLLRSFQQNGVFKIEEMARGETKRAIHGACWYKVYWDPNRGDSKPSPRWSQGPGGDLLPATDPFGNQQWWNAFEGEIAVEHYDIVDVVPDPHATRESEIRHVFHRKLVPMDLVLDRFPYDAFGRKLSEGDFDTNQSYYEVHERDSIENDAKHYESSLGGTKPARAKANQLARIVEFWVKPTNQFPKGGLLVFSGNTILAASQLPYRWPWHLSLGRFLLPASLYSDGDVVHLKDLQRSVNLVASKMKEYIRNCANPALLTPRGANVQAGDFSDIAGDVVEFEGTAGRPEWMSVPNMPSEVADSELRMRDQMADIAAISDIARGQAPPQLETGRALAFLYEFQKGAHEPDIAIQQEMYRNIAQAVLHLAHDFYQEGRLIALVGDNHSWEAYHFQRTDIGQVGRVVIELDNQRPNSRAVRRAEAIEDFTIGAYADTPEAERYREIVNMPSLGTEEIAIKNQHLARAMEEGTGILHGVLPMLLEQDNDELHLKRHQAFVLTPEFRNLPVEWQEAFLSHVAEHEERMVEMLQAQAALGALGQGGEGPSPGGGSGARGAPSPFDGGQGDMQELTPGGEAPSLEAVQRDVSIP